MDEGDDPMIADYSYATQPTESALVEIIEDAVSVAEQTAWHRWYFMFALGELGYWISKQKSEPTSDTGKRRPGGGSSGRGGDKTGDNSSNETDPGMTDLLQTTLDVSVNKSKLKNFVDKRIDSRLKKLKLRGGTKSGAVRDDGRILVGEAAGCGHKTIQAAVDKAPEHKDVSGADAGATVYITPSYDGRKHQETVWIRNKQVKIEGHERSSAGVYPKDGHYAFVIEGTSSYDYPSTRSIKNLTVRGGKGALLSAGLVQFKMESCQVVGAEECARLTTGEGLHTDKQKPVNVETVFRDVNCHFMKGDVFNLEGAAANNKTRFDSCTVNRTDGTAFNVTGASTEIVNATMQFCKGGAIDVNGGPTLSVGVTGSYFESNGAGMDYPRDINIHTGRGTYVKNNYFNAGSHSRRGINVLGGVCTQIKGNTYNNYEQQDGGHFVGVHSDVKGTDVYATTNNGNAPLVGMAHDEVLSFGERVYNQQGKPVNGGVSRRYGAQGVATDT